MGRAHYLTIRCPLGCEAWLQPSALEGHLGPGRCRLHPWVDDLVDSAVVPAPLAGLVLSVLPEALVEEAEHPEVSRSRRNDVGFDFRYGRRIRSPLDGVRARRWLLVATAVLEQQGLRAVQQTLSLDSFLEVEQVVLVPGEQAECPDCGEFVTRRGLGNHRATNSACRWRRAAAEVRKSWQVGWRDPFSIAGAPLTWAELTGRVRWRKRMLTIGFPRWTAVLIMPGDAASGCRPPAAWNRDARSDNRVRGGDVQARPAAFDGAITGRIRLSREEGHRAR